MLVFILTASTILFFVLSAFLSVLDSVESFGNEYMFAYHKGVNFFDYADICAKLTVEDATARIKELFNEEQCSTSVVLPKKDNE